MTDTDNIRTAVVVNNDVSLDTVKAAMPGNYKAYLGDDGKIVIVGHDVAGWTLDDYVIPRLGSFPIIAEEIVTQVTIRIPATVMAEFKRSGIAPPSWSQQAIGDALRAQP